MLVIRDSEDKKKNRGWFKSAIFNQSPTDEEFLLEESLEIQEESMVDMVEEQKDVTQQSANLFSKDNQDKAVVDLLVPLENLIKDRQLALYKNKGLEEQLFIANETITRMKQDLMKKEQNMQEKNKEIRALEVSLTNKQMSYDQLLEDYKEYQTKSNSEYELLSNQLNAEINKYNKFNEENKAAQYAAMLKVSELEEVIRTLEIDNQQYVEKYQKIHEEKAELIKTINEFTKRMSFSFSTVVEDSQEPTE